MAKFNEMIITNVGKSIYAKSIAGQTIEFTKAVVGSGKPADAAEAETLTNLVSPMLTAAITIDTTSEEGIAIVNVSVDNSTITEDIDVSELGLFCKDPDTQEEVMYSYTYAGGGADIIPSRNSGELTWLVQLFVYIENATGSGSEQSSVSAFTPTVTATAQNGTTVFLPNVVATAKKINLGNVLTVFYKITGTLTNMESAESGLKSFTITLPQSSAVECAVVGRMVVTDSTGAQILVNVTGVIAENSSTIDLDYIGEQNGDFSLLITTQYII